MKLPPFAPAFAPAPCAVIGAPYGVFGVEIPGTALVRVRVNFTDPAG